MITMEYKDRKTIIYALKQACDRMDLLVNDIKEAKENGDRAAGMATEQFMRYKKDMTELREKLETRFDDMHCVFLTPTEFEKSYYFVDENDESDEEDA